MARQAAITRSSGRALGWLLGGVAALLLLGLAALGFAHSGIYNIGADDPHHPLTHSLLTSMREASLRSHAARLQVPPGLDARERLVEGAGNYDAMCAQCHLAPGMAPTELSRGLYPSPPNLTLGARDVAVVFWAVKHGIKASGMPAWGHSMGDEYVWNLASFVTTLPTLDADAYRAMVASSGGHSHGGGETAPHGAADHHAGAATAPMDDHHAHDAGDDHHAEPAAPAKSDATAPAHDHAPGTPPDHH